MTQRIPRLKRFDPVYIEWLDAFDVDGAWNNIESLIKTLQPYTVTNLGYYIETLEDIMIFATGYEKLHSERVVGAHSIPIGCIMKIKKIKL